MDEITFVPMSDNDPEMQPGLSLGSDMTSSDGGSPTQPFGTPITVVEAVEPYPLTLAEQAIVSTNPGIEVADKPEIVLERAPTSQAPVPEFLYVHGLDGKSLSVDTLEQLDLLSITSLQDNQLVKVKSTGTLYYLANRAQTGHGADPLLYRWAIVGAGTIDVTGLATKADLQNSSSSLSDLLNSKFATLSVAQDGLSLSYNRLLTDVNSALITQRSYIDVSLTSIQAGVAQSIQSLDGRIVSQGSQLSMLSGQISTKVWMTDIDPISQRVTSAETGITQLSTSINLYAKKTDVDGLSGRISAAESGISLVAGQLTLYAKQQTVVDLASTVSSVSVNLDAANAAIALKADQTSVTALTTRVSSAEVDISAANAAILLKANQTTVNDLSTRVGSAEVNISANTASIALKASQSTVDALGTRVGTAEVNINANTAAIALKASQTSVDSLGTRMGAAEVKIDANASAITLKASQTSVDSLTTRMGTAEVNISGATSSISLVSTKFDGLDTKVSSITVSADDGIKLVGEKVIFSGGQTIITKINDSIAPTTSIANQALTNAAAAQTSANTALQSITDMSSDNLLVPVEKSDLILEYNKLTAEQAGIDAQATAYGITTEKTSYDTAVSAMVTYMATLTTPVVWNSFGGNTTVDGPTFRAKFKAIYDNRQLLLNAIYAKAKTLADNAQSAASNALSQLSNMAADSKLTPTEKKSLRLQWKAVVDSYTANLSLATTYGVTTEKTAYTNAYNSLNSYLNNGTTWVSGYPLWISDAYMSVTTDIVAATFISTFQTFYAAEWTLVNKMSDMARASAATANSLIADISSDSKLTAPEKIAIRKEWETIASEKASIDALATTFSLTTLKSTYDSAFQALATYLNAGTTWTAGIPSWITDANIPTTTAIAPATFRSNFQAYYDAKIAILKGSTEQANINAGNAQTAANNAASSAAAAQSTANTAQSTAASASTAAATANAKLADIASDSILSEGEKSTVIQEYGVILGEQTGIDTQLTTYLLSTEKTAYDNAVAALTTYLGTLTAPFAWNSFSGVTNIVGATFRTKFQDVYTARQAALNAIYAKAKAIADGAVSRLNDIDSDSKMTPTEKHALRAEWEAIALEKPKLNAMATSFGVTTENTTYNSAFQTLANYLNNGATYSAGVPSWIADANLSTTTDIVGGTLRSYLSAYYDAAASLMRKCEDTSRVNAASALSKLSDIASDSILSPVEKGSVIADYTTLINEQAGLDAQATSYGITTEKTAYDSAITALTTYLGTLTAPVAWNVLTGDTTIVGATFRSTFQAAYDARNALMAKLYAAAKTYADSIDSGMKNTIAKNLGYTDYNDMYNQAVAGNTIISGGYLSNSIVDTKALFALEISAKNMLVQGGRVGAFDISGTALIGRGYSNGTLNGNSVVLDPVNNEIVMAVNGVKKVRLTNQTLTSLAYLKVDGGTRYCATGTTVSNTVTTNAILASKNTLAAAGSSGIAKTVYVGIVSSAPVLASTVAGITKMSLTQGQYSWDIPYALNIVHNGNTGDSGVLNRITGSNTATVLVKLMKASGQVASSTDQLTLNIDTAKVSTNNNVFSGTSRLVFSVDTTDLYWIEVTFTLVSGADRPIRYQSWNSGNIFQSGYWSERYGDAIQYDLSVRPGMSVDGSIGITELSNSGFQSVWTPTRYVRIDGNTSNSVFIESQGTWMHNGVTVNFSTAGITAAVDPSVFATKNYIDSAFYTQAASDNRYAYKAGTSSQDFAMNTITVNGGGNLYGTVKSNGVMAVGSSSSSPVSNTTTLLYSNTMMSDPTSGTAILMQWQNTMNLTATVADQTMNSATAMYVRTKVDATNTKSWTGSLVGLNAKAVGTDGAIGTVNQLTGIAFGVDTGNSMVATNMYGILGSYVGLTNGKATNTAAIALPSILGSTNSTQLLLGTSVIPTGSWSIYDTTGYASHFSGRIESIISNPIEFLNINLQNAYNNQNNKAQIILGSSNDLVLRVFDNAQAGSMDLRMNATGKLVWNSNNVYHAGNANSSTADWTTRDITSFGSANLGTTSSYKTFVKGGISIADFSDYTKSGMTMYYQNGALVFRGAGIGNDTSVYSDISDMYVRKFGVNNQVFHQGNSNVTTADWTTRNLISAGVLKSTDFAGSGFTATGWQIGSYSNLLNLDVRGRLQVYEFIQNKINIANGNMIVSDNAKVSSIWFWVDGGSSGTGQHVRYSFDEQHPFNVGDIIKCQSKGKSYMVTVGYIDASRLYFDAYYAYNNSGVSASGAGDLLVRWNSSDVTRKGLLYLNSSDTNAPNYQVLYDAQVKAQMGNIAGLSFNSSTIAANTYGFWSNNAYLDNAYIRGSIYITGGNAATTTTVTDAVNAIQIGAKNLALNTAVVASNADYNTANYMLSQDLTAGESYTATIWGDLYAGKSNFGIWMGGGYSVAVAFTKIKDGVYSALFTAPTDVGGNGKRNEVNIFAVPSSTSGWSTISKFKLEKGNKYTDWMPAPEDVDKAISSIDIGGRNMVQGSDFTSLSKYAIVGNGGVSIDTTVKHNGYNSLKTIQTGLSANAYSGVYTQNIPVTPGEVVTTSIWTYTDSVASFDYGAAVEVLSFDAGYTTRLANAGSMEIKPTANGVWQKFSVTATVPPNAYIIRVAPYVTRNGRLWFSQLKMEHGNKATDWSAAPEDATAYTDALKNTLGSLAYSSLVGTAQLDSTIMTGGYIKTTLLDVNSIIVGGSIATTSAVNTSISSAIGSKLTYITGAGIYTGTLVASQIIATNVVLGTANIADGAITNAKIGSLSADKITAGLLKIGGSSGGNVNGSISVYDSSNKVLFSADKTGAQIAGFFVSGDDLVATTADYRMLKLSASSGSLSFITSDAVERVSITSNPIKTLNSLLNPTNNSISSIPAQASASASNMVTVDTDTNVKATSTNSSSGGNFTIPVTGTNVPVNLTFTVSTQENTPNYAITLVDGEMYNRFNSIKARIELYKYDGSSYTLIAFTDNIYRQTTGLSMPSYSENKTLAITVESSSTVYQLRTSVTVSCNVMARAYSNTADISVSVSGSATLTAAAWSTASYRTTIGDRSISVFKDSSNYLHISGVEADGFIQMMGRVLVNNSQVATPVLQGSAYGSAGGNLSITKMVGHKQSYSYINRVITRNSTGNYTLTHNLYNAGAVTSSNYRAVIIADGGYYGSPLTYNLNSLVFVTRNDSTNDDVSSVFIQIYATDDWL